MSTQIQQVKEASDIAQIIGERISLSRAGRNMKALCPFHSEKSPSFFVSPDIQVFRCFGCGERGDVFTFLEKYEGMTFAEALEMLAERAGIKLEKFQKSQEDTTRERVLELLELSKEYYHYLLITHKAGQVGREYLKDRKTTQESIKLFQLGFSLPNWDGLIKYLVGKKKYDIRDLEKAGMVIMRSNGRAGSTNPNDYYDRFRGRLMFPLTDHRGRVVGFSGRVLDKTTKEAKYINTPETELYHKSKMLFGFSQQYHSIREAKQVIVVEGEFDVLSSSQAFVHNVVAIKGSALTKEHVELLRRTVDTIILSLDADSAGIQATKRAIQIIQQFDEVRLRVLPSYLFGGKDPDDIAREDPNKWRESTKHSESVYQFLIDVAFRQHAIDSGENKQQIVNEVGPSLNLIVHAVERQHYVSILAKRLEVPESALQQDLLRLKVGKQLTTPSKKPVEAQVLDQLTQIEQTVLSILIQLTDSEVLEQARKLDVADFSLPAHQIILKKLQHQSQFRLNEFVKQLPPEAEAAFSTLYFENILEQLPTSKEFQDVLKRMKAVSSQKQMKVLTAELQLLEAKSELSTEEDARMNAILREVIKLRGKS
ncbi:MAG: DNA primase [Patescibacteria group bacterium]